MRLELVVAIFTGNDAQLRLALKNLGEVTGDVRIGMLSDDDRRRKICRQRGDEADERLDAACRSTNYDDIGLLNGLSVAHG